VEVALGVQFADLTGYRTHHAGLLWDKHFRAKFPKCVERPPIDAVFETFGAVRQGPHRLQVQVLEVPGPVVPRLWFISDGDTELVQIQADRFSHNWRREKKAPYPRYEPIRERFFQELADVESFFESEKIGAIEPNQCEVTYVNHITLADDSDPWTQLHRIFEFWGSFDAVRPGRGARLPALEDARFSLRFIISDLNSGEPLGRLHIDGQPVIAGEAEQAIRLNMTARGCPKTPTFQGVEDFLNAGRDAIVRGFAAITTAEMHELWERRK
jgi:uncharacterized protein (TIGR04255 family)